jgi:hypothetical protein
VVNKKKVQVRSPLVNGLHLDLYHSIRPQLNGGLNSWLHDKAIVQVLEKVLLYEIKRDLSDQLSCLDGINI